MINHLSDCALHNGPATIPAPCDCGADATMTPAKYGSEFPITVNRAWLNISGTISLLVGYLSVLEVGDKITDAYLEKLNRHYIPMLVNEKEAFNIKYNESKGGQS